MNKLGRFQLLVELARGGMGIVYVARSVGVGGFSKLHIVKELKPEFAEDPTFLSMFVEEARLSARLEHPNIAETIEVGQDGNRHFMAMEYLRGQSLDRIWPKFRERLSTNAMLRVLCEVLRGLHYAHTIKNVDGSDLGLVHRDMSPSNVFVTYDGEVKILDFGIAKAADTQLETRAGTIKGKAVYMAPEQLKGASKVDARADLFAIGVMIWESIAGARLWEGQTEIEVLRNLVLGNIRDIRTVKPDVPEALAVLCGRALAVDPANRTPSAEELRLEIEAYLDSQKDPVPSLRQIGAVVAEAFASKRKELERLIETGIQTRNADSERSLAVASPSLVTSSGISTSSSVVRGSGLTLTPPGIAEHSGGYVAPKRWRGRTIAGLAIAGALVIGFITLKRGTKEAAATVPPPATPTVQPTPVLAPAEPRTFAVVVNVAPSNAQVLVNGVRKQSPATSRCTLGEQLEVVMSAQGFVTKTRNIACDADTTIDVALERSGAPAAAPPVIVYQPAKAAAASSAAKSASVGPGASSSPPAGNVPPTVDCTVPFTVDSSGIRHPKAGCS